MMQAISLLELLRIHQYVKNFFIFLPLFFALKVTDKELLFNAAVAFVAFSMLASAVYILNDYHDIEEDRSHPRKKKAPAGLRGHIQAAGNLYYGIIVCYRFYHYEHALNFGNIHINVLCFYERRLQFSPKAHCHS